MVFPYAMMILLAIVLGAGIWSGFSGPVFWWHFFGSIGVLYLISFLPLERSTPDEHLREADYSLCPECLYDLRGSPDSGRCPECGLTCTRQEVREVWETAMEIAKH